MAPSRVCILGMWLSVLAGGLHLDVPDSVHVPKVDGELPSLFCIMIAMPHCYEKWFVRTHLMTNMLNGCEGYAIYTNVSADEFWDNETPANFGGTGRRYGNKNGTWYDAIGNMDVGHFNNTQIFIQVWNHAFRVKKYQSFDWTVKVDPDTIFIPERMRTLLVYRNFPPSCILGNWGQSCETTVGAATVISQAAQRELSGVFQKCVEILGHIPYEDMFLSDCLRDHTTVQSIPEPLLVGTFEYCNVEKCGSDRPWSVASHLKSPPFHFHSCIEEMHNTSKKPDFQAKKTCSTGCTFKAQPMVGEPAREGQIKIGDAAHLGLLRNNESRHSYQYTDEEWRRFVELNDEELHRWLDNNREIKHNDGEVLPESEKLQKPE